MSLIITYGEPIAKEKIPKKYKDAYSISNLFWVELANRWRLLYSLVDGESDIEIIAFVLNISDDKKYERLWNANKIFCLTE